MLKEVKSENGSLKLLFDLKNKGKFRYKDLCYSRGTKKGGTFEV